MLSRDSPLPHLPIWNTNINDNVENPNGMPLYVRMPNTAPIGKNKIAVQSL